MWWLCHLNSFEHFRNAQLILLTICTKVYTSFIEYDSLTLHYPSRISNIFETAVALQSFNDCPLYRNHVIFCATPLVDRTISRNAKKIKFRRGMILRAYRKVCRLFNRRPLSSRISASTQLRCLLFLCARINSICLLSRGNSYRDVSYPASYSADKPSRSLHRRPPEPDHRSNPDLARPPRPFVLSSSYAGLGINIFLWLFKFKTIVPVTTRWL